MFLVCRRNCVSIVQLISLDDVSEEAILKMSRKMIVENKRR